MVTNAESSASRETRTKEYGSPDFLTLGELAILIKRQTRDSERRAEPRKLNSLKAYIAHNPRQSKYGR
jgi:hypothetical protein